MLIRFITYLDVKSVVALVFNDFIFTIADTVIVTNQYSDSNQSIQRSRVMNRKKKIKQILTKKMKKANAKLAPKDGKPAYVSKADRAALKEAESKPAEE
jgi:di/tripeptidase